MGSQDVQARYETSFLDMTTCRIGLLAYGLLLIDGNEDQVKTRQRGRKNEILYCGLQRGTNRQYGV